MIVTDMSNLPREQDPFECDWPWGAPVEDQGEPKPPTRTYSRSATFEADLQRVLAMFSE